MNWTNTTLGKLIDVKHGFAFQGEFFSDVGDYILLTPGNCYEKGGLKLKGEKELFYTGEFPREYILSFGDLLIVMTDLVGTAPVLGGAFRIPKDNLFLHNQRLGLVKILDEQVIDKDFLYYLLNSQNYRGQIRGSATGATVRHTSPGRIKKCKVKIPADKFTQHRIGEILSAYDNLIDTNRQRIQLLEESARLLFREWFVYFHFPGYEKVKIVDGVPEGWEKLQVKDIIRTVNSRKKIQKSEYDESGLYPCVDQSQEYISGYTDRKDYVINNTIPIVIFGDHTRIIKYVDFPFVSGADGTQLLVSKHNKINSEFLYFILKNINLSNYFYARHFKFLKDQRILVPSENFCLSFSQFSKNIMKQISIIRSQNQKLTQARDLLLPRLMSGEIDLLRYDKLSNEVEV